MWCAFSLCVCVCVCVSFFLSIFLLFVCVPITGWLFTFLYTGAFIDEFHEDWWHNHDRLESHHGFIQWCVSFSASFFFSSLVIAVFFILQDTFILLYRKVFLFLKLILFISVICCHVTCICRTKVILCPASSESQNSLNLARVVIFFSHIVVDPTAR